MYYIRIILINKVTKKSIYKMCKAKEYNTIRL